MRRELLGARGFAARLAIGAAAVGVIGWVLWMYGAINSQVAFAALWSLCGSSR